MAVTAKWKHRQKKNSGLSVFLANCFHSCLSNKCVVGDLLSWEYFCVLTVIKAAENEKALKVVRRCQWTQWPACLSESGRWSSRLWAEGCPARHPRTRMERSAYRSGWGALKTGREIFCSGLVENISSAGRGTTKQEMCLVNLSVTNIGGTAVLIQKSMCWLKTSKCLVVSVMNVIEVKRFKVIRVPFPACARACSLVCIVPQNLNSARTVTAWPLWMVLGLPVPAIHSL